jgi:hypothetical protein
MTVEYLISRLSQHPLSLAWVLLAVPLLSGVANLAHGKGAGGTAPWKYLHAACIYAACIPGMFSVVLTVYALFFRNLDLLGVNVLVYFLPIASMAATLLSTRRAVQSFDEVPGFGRLSGLMIMLGLSLGTR